MLGMGERQLVTDTRHMSQ